MALDFRKGDGALAHRASGLAEITGREAPGPQPTLNEQLWSVRHCAWAKAHVAQAGACSHERGKQLTCGGRCWRGQGQQEAGCRMEKKARDSL